ncbi:DODA-type extradiol aromatic ring-opening family dioxygenase [Cypionkella sp. TWP1-2-1b2]|uniref:DODA-type extradiol aromatic ring-opening family dioxygenase n=1 Tax=Cypionkella sp. TWP1-2-1b2 TaxID=2804675 RepID=UPI003CFB793A
MPKLPTYFISHGGGPWPWLPNMRQMLASLETSLARMPSEIGTTPKAILMISGHWEEDDFAVMSSPSPGMLYDYGGFPHETYQIIYPAPGAPDLAQRTADLIRAAGLPTHLDPKRGFDHGTFAPAYVMYPNAEIPIYQVSLQHSYDPAAHIALGRAIAPLRDEGVLIIGSGLSYHNLLLFGPGAKAPSTAFDTWLSDTMALPEASRTKALLDWDKAPSARICHPQEDHLVPLFAALGAAENETATMVYHDKNVFGGVTASSYRIG